MITLVTGLNGHGKGVYTLDWLKHKAEKEGRTVYYNGIRECKIPGWIELEDPKKWYDLPPGSYFVQDESQEHYRPRHSGSVVPEHVQKLERHREAYSLDLVFMTPHPMLLDGNLRRLVGQHFHVVRKWGRPSAVIHEWNQVRENCDKSRKDSVRFDYRYNKEVYNWYKSSSVHTPQGKPPMRYYMMFVLPFIVAGLIYTAYHFLNPKKAAEHIAPLTASQQATQGQISKLEPKLNWFEARAPRVAGLPQTAAVYDEVTKPTKAPYPAACVLTKSKGCTCYSQQATRLTTSEDLCRQIVANGYFVDFDDGSQPVDKPQSEPTAQATEGPEYAAPVRGETVAAGSVDLAQQPRIPSNIGHEPTFRERAFADKSEAKT